MPLPSPFFLFSSDGQWQEAPPACPWRTAARRSRQNGRLSCHRCQWDCAPLRWRAWRGAALWSKSVEKHAAEVGGLDEPAVAIVHRVFPEPVEETCHIVNRRGKEVLGGDAVPNGENDGTGVPRVVVRLKARPPRWLKREWQWLLYLPSSSVVAAPRHFAWMRRRLHRATVCHGQAGGAHCKWASEEDWKKGEEDKSKTVILFVFSLINWMDIIF